MYYLAVLCVAKYRSILDTVGGDDSEEVITEPLSTPGNNSGGNLDEGGQNSLNSGEGGQSSVHSGERVSNNKTSEGGQNDQILIEKDHNDEQSDARSIQRPTSVETDCSTTPDLDQAFQFPSHEGAAAVGESSMPASVTFYRQSMDTSEQIEVALRLVGPFLCRLMVTNRGMLSKVLVGSDGRPLLTDGKDSI